MADPANQKEKKTARPVAAAAAAAVAAAAARRRRLPLPPAPPKAPRFSAPWRPRPLKTPPLDPPPASAQPPLSQLPASPPRPWLWILGEPREPPGGLARRKTPRMRRAGWGRGRQCGKDCSRTTVSSGQPLQGYARARNYSIPLSSGIERGQKWHEDGPKWGLGGPKKSGIPH